MKVATVIDNMSCEPRSLHLVHPMSSLPVFFLAGNNYNTDGNAENTASNGRHAKFG